MYNHLTIKKHYKLMCKLRKIIDSGGCCVSKKQWEKIKKKSMYELNYLRIYENITGQGCIDNYPRGYPVNEKNK